MTAEIILLNGNIYSDEVTQEWVRTYTRHATYNMQGPFFACDKNGNSYMLGNDIISDTAYYLVIVKYNSAGVQQWLTLYNYPEEPYYEPLGIALDTSGNAYIISNYGQSTFTSMNILTVKFNGTNGNVIWSKKYIGQYGSSTPKDIKIDKQNNIFITGYADSSLICIKYNSITGDSIWVRKYKQPGTFTSGNSCTIDDSSNVIITGYKAFCIPYPPPGGCFDTLLTVKYNRDGLLRWAKTYFNPNRTDLSLGLKVVNDQYGSSYILGRTLNNMGYNIFLTLKYDRNGLLQWASTYDSPGASNNDEIQSFAVDKKNGFVFVTGYSIVTGNIQSATIKYNSVTGDTVWVKRYSAPSSALDVKSDSMGNCYITGAFSNDVLTLKYSPQGNINWLITYNGSQNLFDGGRILELDNYKNIYVCGITGYDYLVIKYSQIIGVKPLCNKIPAKFELNQNYPNPFNPITKIKLSIPKKSYVQLKIYDVLGRIKEVLIDKELTASDYEVTFNASNYSSGVYFYQLIADNKIIETKKLTVIK